MGRASLRRRVTFAGVGVVALVVVALDAFVYLTLRDRMESNLGQVLDAREQLVGQLGEELSAEALSDRLDDLGLRAVVRTGDGRVLHSRGVAEPTETLPAGGDEGEALEGRVVPLADGGEVAVLASRAAIDETLQRLLLLAGVGTVVVIVLAYALLARTSAVVLRPVRDVAVTARRIGAGRSGERLSSRPHDVELAEMVAAFNEMLDALEAAVERSQALEQASREFLADAAHQLRTPIAGIRASVGTLLRTDDPDDHNRMLDHLARESARTARLLSSLLRVAQLDRRQPPALQHASVAELVGMVVERQRTLAPHLSFTVDGADDTVVVIDRDGIHEAISNLLDNAVRHAAATIRVTTATDTDDITVRVADDGPGVPPHQQERVFDRFVSLDGGGSGLGLAIARGIAEQHGGWLSYTDGAFVLRLPRSGRGPGSA
jgi:signal transduction histidine kinase